MKIVKTLEESGLLIKGVSGTIENEAKEQKCGFFSALLGAWTTSSLGSVLAGEGVVWVGERVLVLVAVKIFMLSHSLVNFKIQKKYQNKPKFKGGYLKNNLPRVKDGAYVISLDD